MRIVIDTNVVVSAFLSARGAPAQLFAAFQNEAFDLVVSAPILAEYQRALSYPRVQSRHQMSDIEIAEVIEAIQRSAIVVEPADIQSIVVKDPDDHKFFECARAGEVEYIVSGDIAVQAVGEYHGIQVVSPAVFLQLLEQGIA